MKKKKEEKFDGNFANNNSQLNSKSKIRREFACIYYIKSLTQQFDDNSLSHDPQDS